MKLFSSADNEPIKEQPTKTLFLEDTSFCLFDESYILKNWYFLTEAEKAIPEVAKKVEELKDKAHPQNLVNQIKAIHNSIYEKTPEQLVNNQKSVMSDVKRFLMVAGSFVINPALGLIVLWVDHVTKKKLVREQKGKILQDFKDELTLVEEKIRDETDKEKKYKLMQLKNTLERSMDKIISSPVDEEE